jgi:hypothetical protein
MGIAVLVVGCATGSDDEATPTASVARDPGQATLAPVASDPPVGPSPTPVEPSPTGSTPTDEPATTPSPPPVEPPSTSGPASATECAGTDKNRDFFAAVAAGVDWAVFCPVLGSGWFVDAGQYRLAGGGQMTISYKGPSGASFELRQGRVCDDETCDASGSDLGSAAYGALTGTMFDVGGGDYSLLVDPDATPSWTFLSSGLSEAVARTISADLVRFGG